LLQIDFYLRLKNNKQILMFTLNSNGRLLTINKPLVMGILNSTPDSFYKGSSYQEKDILSTAEKMLHDGATILDIGGQSTRPGAAQISVEEELKRVIPVIEAIAKHFPEAFISIDTYQSPVAKEAVNAGANIVNDISGCNMDEDMMNTVASLKVPYILMHMQGTPSTMQQNPHYENVTREVLDFFIQKISLLRSKDIKDIIIDPGIGFGKTVEHNFTLLKNLSAFKMLDCPVLLGVSRKSVVYKTLDTTATHALNGTTVLNTIGLLNGAVILRVHDVNEAAEAVKLIEQYRAI
jgi:dihydropteroate synthase